MENESNDVVLNFHDSLLYKADVSLLDDQKWLNDKLLGFCFEYFEREKFNHSADKLSLINPDVAQCIKLLPSDQLGEFLEPLNLPSKQYVFLPVNDNSQCEQTGGSHWSLLVYIRSRQEFRHYDSSKHTNQEEAKRLAYKLQPYVLAPMGRMKFLEMDGPQQNNSYDCGVFVIATAEHLCKELCEGYSIPLNDIVTPKTVTETRRKIKDLIYQTAKEYSGS
ncbi:sentrin-specific protease 8-like [Saccostrea echinata]|uniref:sentrin-specific protease 8-like n=1 Tax=Saccostrea echinata TaxID=191078 RepID=UPI002A841230|nr:sentrin-specific protease 8-like [Saccostrea echinata]